MNAEMQALFTEAEQKDMWLWCGYQDLWFSPAKLRKEQAAGRFRWGAVNWKLRNPKEKLAALDREAARITSEHSALTSRLRHGR
jgi:hypothetical protein